MKLTSLIRHMSYEASFIAVPDFIFSENAKDCSS